MTSNFYAWRGWPVNISQFAPSSQVPSTSETRTSFAIGKASLQEERPIFLQVENHADQTRKVSYIKNFTLFLPPSLTWSDDEYGGDQEEEADEHPEALPPPPAAAAPLLLTVLLVQDHHRRRPLPPRGGGGGRGSVRLHLCFGCAAGLLELGRIRTRFTKHGIIQINSFGPF